MPAETIPGTVTTIKSSEAFYGNPHLLPVDAEGVMIPVENGTLNDWMLPVIILGLLFFSIAWYNFSPRVKQSMKATVSLRFFYLIDKEGTFFRETPTYLLFGNFLLTASLLVYQSLQHQDVWPQWMSGQPVAEYALLLLALLLFYPLKLGMIRFLAWVFGTHRASHIYSENLFMTNNMLGLLLLPLVFYNAFNLSAWLLFFMWVMLIIIYVFKVIRGAYLANQESGFSLYYLFLYLCAVELAPLCIIGKAVIIYVPDVTGIIVSE